MPRGVHTRVRTGLIPIVAIAILAWIKFRPRRSHRWPQRPATRGSVSFTCTGIAGIAIVMPDPCAAPLLRRPGVSAWTGEAEDPVLRHTRGPRRLLDDGRRPGAVV